MVASCCAGGDWVRWWIMVGISAAGEGRRVSCADGEMG
jgi:hypothetical protein